MLRIRGSITVFFSLILSVMIALICSGILSVKVAAGRAQIANSLDLAMYSLFGQYDRELLDQYHLFFYDAGYGSGQFMPGKLMEEVEEQLSYGLNPGKGQVISTGIPFLQLDLIESAITGYTLASDGQGAILKEQAVDYMRETLGIQGVRTLLNKLEQQKQIVSGQLSAKETADENGKIDEYESVKEEARKAAEVQASENDRTVAEQQASENDGTVAEQQETASQAVDAIQCLEAVEAVHKSSLLQLVLPKDQKVSDFAIDKNQCLSETGLSSGMGVVEIDTEGLTEETLFQEYLLQVLPCYTTLDRGSGPSYQLEYVLGFKHSDVENLEYVVQRLLLLREAANVLHLYTNGAKKAQIKTLATAITAMLLVPQLEILVEGIIIAAWAFVESLVDVRALLDGGNIYLIKDADSWQVEFSQIPAALTNLDGVGNSGGNMDYKGYLRLLLYLMPAQEKLTRSMDMMQVTMRQIAGKEKFSFNCALESLEMEIKVRSENQITFTSLRKTGYKTLREV